MNNPRILAFAGSLRRDSWNKKLARVAAEGARTAGAEVTLLDLTDLPLPVFNEDLERDEGTPANATRLKELMVAHHGLLIASPEYNSSVTAALKNAIDWASRNAKGEPPLVAFQGKVAALCAASPGQLGGLRGLVTLRSILSNIGVVVLPQQVALPKAHELFAPTGELSDASRDAQVKKLGADLAQFLLRLG